MKICCDCKRDLPLSEFYTYKRKNRETIYARCKSCQRAKLRSAYPKDKKTRERRAARQKAYDFVAEIKNQPCTDCGELYPPYVMDFDHVQGKKIKSIAYMTGRYSLQQIKDEIAKCELVCSNCHRVRTHKRKNNIPL